MATPSEIAGLEYTLVDPPLNAPSQIAGLKYTLRDPVLQAPSQIAGVSFTLRRPHHPRAVMTESGLRYVPRLVWDGEQLR